MKQRMKIIAKWFTTATQVHNGKCYFIGCIGDNVHVYNMEAGGTGGTGNIIFDNSEVKSIMLPKPGAECTNGIYVDNDCFLYYSLG